MEADWEVEIGGDDHVIDACWDGLVDLRYAPSLAAQLPEARHLPAFADALARLNSGASPFWTSKCDVWSPEKIDPDELDARPAEAGFALACYIDLLPWSDHRWASVHRAVDECRDLCVRLRWVPLRCCRADLIVRSARRVPHHSGLGITAYLTACAPAVDTARATLGSALNALVHAILRSEQAAPPSPKLQ